MKTNEATTTERRVSKLELLLRDAARVYAEDPSSPGVITSLLPGRNGDLTSGGGATFYAAVLRFHKRGGEGREVVVSETHVDLALAVRAVEARWRTERPEPTSSQRRFAQSQEERFALAGLHLLISWDTDRGRIRNGIGFSKADTDLGRALAERAETDGLDETQWDRVIRMAHKYRRQIGELRDRERTAAVRALRVLADSVERVGLDGASLASIRQAIAVSEDPDLETDVETAVREAIEADRAVQ